ncbi:NUDIX domain-containing protein [Gulosibacter molinativorax]|uniref:NUDIX hydrolase n=1 Tax=Gulosibacter molinativorax TaxID=256821 RepID=A0ABT7C440_9MICO|nr:NUDIX domain-containing protein [Gulosibacter molinativorax]MDJ1369981.1 NUDIX hydrolase [Gulosibacter molinativorax]QUY63829.1 Hydrolase, NUDIX family [Gulosibacter molinativorax]
MSSEQTPEDLGAKTGYIPVFSQYVPGSPEARSEHLPDHYTNEPKVRDEGDYWAVGPDGTKMWGRFGAAGLLTFDTARGVLMQHRALWSHYGGTWGIPGGALNAGETALDAAVREAHEEALVPPDALDPLFSRVVDLGFWSYTTFVVETLRPFEAQITDDESAGLAWVVPKEFRRLKLHPGFAKAWPTLEPLLEARPLIVVDVANLVGTTPNGWWRSPAAAARTTIHRIARVAEHGVPASLFGFDAQTSWPALACVVEGKQSGAAAGLGPLPGRVDVIPAEGSGDDEIVDIVRRSRDARRNSPVLVATSDRALRTRVEALGATTIGSAAFLELAGSES